jgi:hypothetical protein
MFLDLSVTYQSWEVKFNFQSKSILYLDFFCVSE